MSAHPILDAVIGDKLVLKPRDGSSSGYALEPVTLSASAEELGTFSPILLRQGYQQSKWAVSVTKHHGSDGFLAKGFLNDITRELCSAGSSSRSEAIGMLIETISLEEKDSPFTIHLKP